MKRLRRWVIYAAPLVSLVMCLVSAGLWVRSEYIYDQVLRYAIRSDQPSTPIVTYFTFFETYSGEVCFDWNVTGYVNSAHPFG
jgi:hypothetical protein